MVTLTHSTWQGLDGWSRCWCYILELLTTEIQIHFLIYISWLLPNSLNQFLLLAWGYSRTGWILTTQLVHGHPLEFIFQISDFLIIMLTKLNSAFGDIKISLLSYKSPVLSIAYAAAVSDSMKSFIWPVVILLQRPMFTELSLPWFIST